MKKIFNYSIIGVLVICIASCDNGFDELNTNKTAPIYIDPAFQLNHAVIQTSFFGGVLIYDMGIVQQIISPNSGVITGANYNQDNRDATVTMWQGYYRNVIRNTKDIIAQTQNVPERSNLLNMARILQAYAFMVLTDEYGDIPYFEGGSGKEQIAFPVYDPQSEIYADIIKELGEAAPALNAAGKIETGDALYGGNVDKWKKFAYSLMLRAGMRMSKVDPGQAETVVKAAVLGGVITSNADNAVVRHDNNFRNGVGNTL